MKLDKIPLKDNTNVVEIITNHYNPTEHSIYMLDETGNLIDRVLISDASIGEVLSIVKHMVIIHFTDKQAWEMRCNTMFNNIFEPDFIPYDELFAWQMNKTLVDIIRHFGKCKNVHNYKETTEYRDEVHILDDFINGRPTPIEQKDENVHKRGAESRQKILNYLEEWTQYDF